jgi:hypothetical protein
MRGQFVVSPDTCSSGGFAGDVRDEFVGLNRLFSSPGPQAR